MIKPLVPFLIAANLFAATITLPVNGNTAAVQAAINQSAAGDTIQCNAGTYPISPAVNFLSGRTYSGAVGCIFTGAGYLVQLEYNNAHDVTINNFTFNGGGILANGDNSHPGNNVRITSNRFTNIIEKGNYTSDGVHAWTGFHNSVISGNTFQNIYDGDHVGGSSEVCGAIWLFDGDTTTIASNVFNKVCQAVHVTLRKNSVGTFNVSGNQLHLVARYGIEIQGPFAAPDVTISGNIYDTPQPGINGQTALSLAVGGPGHTITQNQLSGPNQVNPAPHQSAAIEAQGNAFKIQNNSAGHFQSAQLIQFSDQLWVTTNNTWCDMIGAPGQQIIYLNTAQGGLPAGTDNNNTYSQVCPTDITTPPNPIPPPTPTKTMNCTGTIPVAGTPITLNCTVTTAGVVAVQTSTKWPWIVALIILGVFALAIIIRVTRDGPKPLAR